MEGDASWFLTMWPVGLPFVWLGDPTHLFPPYLGPWRGFWWAPKKKRSSTSIIGSSYTGNLSKPAQKRKKKRNILKIWTIQNCTLNQSSNRCCDPWFKKLGSWKLECKLLAALYGLVRLCSAFGVGDGFYYHAG